MKILFHKMITYYQPGMVLLSAPNACNREYFDNEVADGEYTNVSLFCSNSPYIEHNLSSLEGTDNVYSAEYSEVTYLHTHLPLCFTVMWLTSH